MPTISDYYRDLLAWEEVPPRKLIYQWPPDLRKAADLAIREAYSASGLDTNHCSIRVGSTNQSIGNQVEEHVITRLSSAIRPPFSLRSCSGAGYPDKTLVFTEEKDLRIALEVKATSDWNPRDSNRRVLTSSSEKLRRQFSDPIHHLLLTIIYEIKNECACVEALRLDFLEPTTPVSVRLEASVNHKLLATGTHHSSVLSSDETSVPSAT